jgi:Arc/MetJ-type ribon-helix-helix transcriptional regulator
MDTIIEVKIPEQLLQQTQTLVKEGWISDLDVLVVEALRRYNESHQSQLTEAFIQRTSTPRPIPHEPKVMTSSSSKRSTVRLSK